MAPKTEGYRDALQGSAFEGAIRDRIRKEGRLLLERLASPEAHEATSASLEKRPPDGEHVASTTSPPIVSFEDEPLVLVNDADDEVGFATKQRCHDGEGLLHRAFSVFLFSPEGDVLLQQRSAQKRLWPTAWSNACCSHPRRGETLGGAVQRRLREELALDAPVRFLFKFRYHARYDAAGAEHELCHVYAGPLISRPAVNPNEVAATTLMPADALDRELAARPELYTPWLKLEWARIREVWPTVQEILGAPGR